MSKTATLTTRVSLREACAALGICDKTFRRKWATTFTDYRTDGGYRRISRDELDEALKHTDPHKARAAVLRLRNELERT